MLSLRKRTARIAVHTGWRYPTIDALVGPAQRMSRMNSRIGRAVETMPSASSEAALPGTAAKAEGPATTSASAVAGMPEQIC
jgi:hypothetical protein